MQTLERIDGQKNAIMFKQTPESRRCDSLGAKVRRDVVQHFKVSDSTFMMQLVTDETNYYWTIIDIKGQLFELD